jgi:hypothetical protein
VTVLADSVNGGVTLPACPAGEQFPSSKLFDPCRLVRQVKQFDG